MFLKTTQNCMTDDQVKVMDSIRVVLAENKIDQNIGSNILVSLLADIYDGLPQNYKKEYRANVFSAFDAQAENLANQSPTK
jgi:hypothetical protein